MVAWKEVRKGQEELERIIRTAFLLMDKLIFFKTEIISLHLQMFTLFSQFIVCQLFLNSKALKAIRAT